MKIVLLDIDGVLNHQTFYNKRYKLMKQKKWKVEYPLSEFCPNSIFWLNKLTDLTGAKIVLSSSWRLGRSLEELVSLFKQVEITGELIDKTPLLFYKNCNDSVERGAEIQFWLENKGYRIYDNKKDQSESILKSGIENFIILDDDNDILYNQRRHFVHIPHPPKHNSGFNKKYFEIALKKLNQTSIELNKLK